MRPIDYRNETFEGLLARGLVNERLAVYQAFQKFGPGTTREISQKSGIYILSLRPRATELYQLGFLKLLDFHQPSRTTPQPSEGIYRAFTYEEARAKFFVDKRGGDLSHQPELSL